MGGTKWLHGTTRKLVPRTWAGAGRAASMVAIEAPAIPRPGCLRNARRFGSDGAGVSVSSFMPGSPRSGPDGERAERLGSLGGACRVVNTHDPRGQRPGIGSLTIRWKDDSAT